MFSSIRTMNLKSQAEKFPEEFYAYIEISQGDNMKYEYKEELPWLVLDRILSTSMIYPTNYGFIPLTRAADGDPLDTLVISSFPIAHGVIVKCKPIGLAEMQDEEGIDDKIISVPTEKIDPLSRDINEIDDIPNHTKENIRHFFEHYKELEEGKFMKFKGFKSKEEAISVIKNFSLL